MMTVFQQPPPSVVVDALRSFQKPFDNGWSAVLKGMRPMKNEHKGEAVSSAVALVLGRVLQQVGANLMDEDMINRGQVLEMRADEALKRGLQDLPPKN
jgi:hypothetical protein